jgi:hydroxysqualene synthase
VVGSRGHYENFPVGSILLPRPMRRHLAAVYAFARTADDFADEGNRSADERLDLLARWQRRLALAAASAESGATAAAGEPADTPQIFLALGQSIRELALPITLFEDLLSAFRQDVTQTRYGSWAEVFEYCRRSANPVGRLVLRIAGHRDARLDQWSDAVCTALQLTNFWQDVKIDAERGRIYLPAEERRAHGAHEDDLLSGRISPGWQHALAAAAARTRRLFEAGRPVCDAVGGRLRYELRATWLGGVRILDRLESARFDVVTQRPSLGAADAPWLAWHLVTWRGTRGVLAGGLPASGPS